MKKFNFITTVETETLEQAMETMARRLGHDDDYGYPYTVDWVHANVELIDDEHEIAEYTMDEYIMDVKEANTTLNDDSDGKQEGEM